MGLEGVVHGSSVSCGGRERWQGAEAAMAQLGPGKGGVGWRGCGVTFSHDELASGDVMR